MNRLQETEKWLARLEARETQLRGRIKAIPERLKPNYRNKAVEAIREHGPQVLRQRPELLSGSLEYEELLAELLLVRNQIAMGKGCLIELAQLVAVAEGTTS